MGGSDEENVSFDPIQMQQMEGPQTMKTQLQAVAFEDPTRVFIVRRINKLGFASSSHLKQYFSRFGEVKSVHVSHSRVKSQRVRACGRTPVVQWRLRAAAIGFVVMSSEDSRHSILAAGPEHDVCSVMVRVYPFQRRNLSLEEGGELLQMTEFGEGDMFQEDWGCGGDAMPDHNLHFSGSPMGMQAGHMGHVADVSCSMGSHGANPMFGVLYVSEQELQDAMPQQYED